MAKKSTQARAGTKLQGNVFVVRQSDGKYTVGQLLDTISPHIARICLFDDRINGPRDWQAGTTLQREKIIAAITTTVRAITAGDWPLVGAMPEVLEISERPGEGLRNAGWVGLKTYSSPLVESFLEAYWGLAYWDEYVVPVFDEMLLPGRGRPQTAKYMRS